MAILDDVKISLRISGTAYDTEVTDLITAAKADLALCGLVVTSDTDTLVKRAIMAYCKANFGYDNPEADRFRQSYEMLRNHLSMSADYAFFSVAFTITDSVTLAPIREAKIDFNGEAKETNASGVAIFYVRAGSNYEYTITADDYESDEPTDTDPNLIDVAADTAVPLSLVAI